MADSYCDDADLYAHGLPRGAAPNPGRLVREVSASANTITLDVHGLALNDRFQVRAEAGGSLPAPLAANTDYYAIPLSESVFQAAAAADGAAIDLTTAGARVLVIVPLPLASARAWASRLIDDMLPGHVVPLEAPFPDVVRMTAAELAAAKILALQGAGSASLTRLHDDARKRLERWAKGIPIRGEGSQQPAQVAASASVPYADARGWSRWGGL